MQITTEGLFMIIGVVVGATVWIVNSINGVQKSIEKLGITLTRDIDDHEKRITSLEEEVWPDR